MNGSQTEEIEAWEGEGGATPRPPDARHLTKVLGAEYIIIREDDVLCLPGLPPEQSRRAPDQSSNK